MTSTDAIIDFEKSLQQLEEIVNKMEQGKLSLEQSLDSFEDGVQLTRHCQDALKKAEQRVSKLTQNNDEISLTPFATEE